ncbi:ATP-binding cassette sub-family A member 9-like [Echinops telfairi]|uniref:ATP-binding cassette sub-family A member 9-like n=2 Tax=Echinops telfairi TaxID=9371 RepID=A0AC55DU72_ECHTE|nr:ATP-binding cassette sub-family A member 9-like [Echinops telfairi]XP_045155296.1 ATP-binding cassette sub-family A member 9-like [Echinops telfairi]
MVKKEISVFQQTQALLCKNFLKKWRKKTETLLEWTLALFMSLYLCFSPESFTATQFPEHPAHVLGPMGEFNDSELVVAYTPVTNLTRRIMDKVALAPFMKGRELIEAPDERTMDRLYNDNTDIIGIVFADIFSYQLKLDWGYRIPHTMEHPEYSKHCQRWSDHISCSLKIYWEKGLVVFQSAINAAIIEIATNHSVMEKLLSVTGINMRTLPFITKSKAINELVMLTSIMSFSPFVYFLSLNITKERKRLKKLMTMMGLRESAFW